jgi:hypothetical protein
MSKTLPDNIAPRGLTIRQSHGIFRNLQQAALDRCSRNSVLIRACAGSTPNQSSGLYMRWTNA